MIRILAISLILVGNQQQIEVPTQNLHIAYSITTEELGTQGIEEIIPVIDTPDELDIIESVDITTDYQEEEIPVLVDTTEECIPPIEPTQEEIDEIHNNQKGWIDIEWNAIEVIE